MILRVHSIARRGTILPIVVIGIVALCGFVALAIDIGMVAVAKTQAQNAADAAAFAGARTIDGSASGNTLTATSNAKNTATSNTILGRNISVGGVTITHGAYHYDSTSQTFSPQYPPQSPDNYNLTKATVTNSSGTFFARVFNISAFTVSATAVAAHRPTDACIVLDFSGSMNNESDLWNCESYLGSLNGTSNNTDPIYPQWGFYTPSFSPLAAIQCTSSDTRVGYCNVTQAVGGIGPMANDYYQNARGNSAIAAFAPATTWMPSTGKAQAISVSQPGGDQPFMKKGSTTTPALTGYDITNTTTGKASYSYAANNLAANVGNTFYGYTQGPGYWGMSFFVWPPDPNNDSNGNSNDWRKKFFFMPDGTTPLNDNTKLFASNGVLNNPSGNYVINYKAILAWIKANCVQQAAGDGKPFPPILRAANMLYYDSIPSDVPAGSYTWTSANSSITDPNQRFWKEYIDFALGVWHDPLGNIQVPGNPSCSYGPDFTPGTTTGGQGIQISGPSSTYTTPSGSSFIDAKDNPKRPRHRFWFGPMTMIQFMSDTGLFPGITQDISMLPAKLGIQGALTDIQNNHPNDLIAMLMFARPHYNGEPMEVSDFTYPVSNLSRDYTSLINSLWFPPNSGTADVRPWDANGLQTPRAHGDYDANTATSYGLMLAYNQLSSNSSLVGTGLGGFGRKGAQRLIILETDGMANVATNAGFTSSSAYNSYYNLGGNNISVGSADPAQDAINVATKIAALTTDTTNGPGYATPNKSVIIHCLAFGAIFEPTAQDGQSTAAMSMLQQISAIGGTGFPASVTDTTSPFYYKLCTGTLAQRQAKLQTAFTTILDSTVAIVMVQ